MGHRFYRLGASASALAVMASGGCARTTDAHLYASAPFAPSYSAGDVAGLKVLGSKLVDKGVNFSVYSEHATKLQLALFDDPESSRPTRTFEMTRQGDVWSVYVEGVGLGQAYGYIAWGPNWPYDSRWYPGSIYGFIADVDADGNRFDPNKLLMDPYAHALHREHDWSKGSIASGPERAQSTFAAAAKSLVSKSSYVWSDGEATWRMMRQDPNAPGHRFNDLIVYEAHVKGFTMDAASGAQHPGTYRGLGERADYFKELGVTAVELMPVFEKPLDGGYWGYQTLGFFIPEREYSYAKERDQPTEEFKWMVDQLHQRGIEVILDVVYNHTGEGGLWREKIQGTDLNLDPSLELYNFDPKEVAGLYSFRGLDNQAYYALAQDRGFYWNNTGVGNETRCNHTPMRRLILDSLRYWVTDMHVDGFRFDLGPILGEKDGNTDPTLYNQQDDPANTVEQEIVDDPVLQQYNTRLVAEPWSLAAFSVGKFPASSNKDGTAWGEWNGPFRDWWRSFVNDDTWKLNSTDNDEDFGGLMLGSSKYYQWNNRRPYNSVNFVTVHDGFTMYDLFTYAQKRNGCGPLNPVCCNNPLSAFCDNDSGESNNRSLDWSTKVDPAITDPTAKDVAANVLRRQMMRNLFAAMLLANGTPLILGGDEWERTQLGNNNAYSSGADNAYNWFQWGAWQADPNRVRMHDFVAKLAHYRTARGYALAPAQFGPSPVWLNSSGQPMADADWGGKAVAVYYRDVTGGPALLILINMGTAQTTFNLPSDHPWNRVLDTQSYFDTDAYFSANGLDPSVSQNINTDAPAAVPGNTYGVPDHSLVVLEAAP